MEKIYVIDAVNYLFRSYFAIRRMTNSEGFVTNALFGFIRSIQKICKDFTPEHIVAVFDGPDNKASRIEIYEDYKGHRESMPEDLWLQLDLAKQFCLDFGIPILEVPGVEADDVMGSVAKIAQKNNSQVFLCSSDKDLCQLVNDRVFIIQTHKDNFLIGAQEVENIYGIKPHQMIDYLAIVGDPSDNIPGIKGFGAKTAQKILQDMGSLQALLDDPQRLNNAKKEQKVRDHEKDALISQKLATIDVDIDIPTHTDFYALKPRQIEKLKELYIRMNFSSLIKDLGFIPDPTQKKSPSLQYQVDADISTKECLKRLQTANQIALYLFADHLCLGSSKVGFFTIPLAKVVSLKTLFSDTKKQFIGYDIKYTMHKLHEYGIEPTFSNFDVMIGAYLIDPTKNTQSLSDIFLEFLGVSLDTEQKETLFLCTESLEKLLSVLQKSLEEKDLTSLMQKIETPLLSVLWDMEQAGIFLDTEKVQELEQTISKEIKTLEKTIYQYAKEPFNINSPKQLNEVLFQDLGLRKWGKKTIHGYSTSSSVLERLVNDHPIIKPLLSYRTLEKLYSTYITKLPAKIDPGTGRIHCTFHQTVTATGRLSCSNPNLQNIPVRTELGKKIRECFSPQKEGWSFLSADYSQIELRILAHLSQDFHLIEIFQNDDDIHKITASHIFQVPKEQVTHEMRFRAKAVIFGIIYGQGAMGLSKGLNISMKDASLFIEMTFNTYPQVKEFIDATKEKALSSGQSVTLMGRKRPLPGVHSKNQQEKAQALRFAVNAPVQGLQADIIKKAMISLQKELLYKKTGFLVLQIHDELLLECQDTDIKYFKEKLKSHLEEAYPLSVPLKANVSLGKNWGICYN